MATTSRAMQIVSVRFGSQQIELIQQEATIEGVSASQWIRDAAYAKAVLTAARRNAAVTTMWQGLIAVIEEAGHDLLAGQLRDALDVVHDDERDGHQSHGI